MYILATHIFDKGLAGFLIYSEHETYTLEQISKVRKKLDSWTRNRTLVYHRDTREIVQDPIWLTTAEQKDASRYARLKLEKNDKLTGIHFEWKTSEQDGILISKLVEKIYFP